jgi:AAA+ superfamily predicted ATPase
VTAQPYPDSAAHLADEVARLAALLDVDPSDSGARRESEAGREKIDARLAATTPGVSRLAHLATTFGLSAQERDLVVIGLLPELGDRYRARIAELERDAMRELPSVELAMALTGMADGPATARRLLHPAAPLRAHRLVDLAAEDLLRPLAAQALYTTPGAAAYVLGADVVDPALVGVRLPLGASERRETPAERGALADQTATWWRRLRDTPGRAGSGGIVQLRGPRGVGRLALAVAAAERAGAPVVLLDATALIGVSASPVEAIAVAYRDACLAGAVVVWLGAGSVLGHDSPEPTRRALLESAAENPVLTFFLGEEPFAPAASLTGPRTLVVELAAPRFDERQRIWEAALAPVAELGPERARIGRTLARAFQLTAGGIDEALHGAWLLARGRNPARPELTENDVFEACRRLTAGRLDHLARRIEPRTDLAFKDLVLPCWSAEQLNLLRRRIGLHHRVYEGLRLERRVALGHGMVALFAGPPGTGKTMAAELIAAELGVELYAADLAQLVSKYVGETEENLDRLFRAAEESSAMLLFDEADAIFGRRGEVREARDRWANLEVNYLLQRIEQHPGAVILCTNLRQNIDEAFLRRIHALVEFPLPDAGLRLRIWQGLFPDGVDRPPNGELAALAERFNLSGGRIRNVVVDAVFRSVAEASGDRPVVTLRHLVAAIGADYRKAGAPVTIGEFGDEFASWLLKEAA